jgi:tRNA wybutosine-synthesizing protein 5
MPFGEFIRRCAPEPFVHLPPLAPVLEKGERLYLRSVATGPEASKTASHLEQVFPEIAADVVLPHGVVYDEQNYHSSVLRVASRDTELWTHYDVMHNLLIQVTGSKRVTLWPPCEDANLYTEGAAAKRDARTCMHACTETHALTQTHMQ